MPGWHFHTTEISCLKGYSRIQYTKYGPVQIAQVSYVVHFTQSNSLLENNVVVCSFF